MHMSKLKLKAKKKINDSTTPRYRCYYFFLAPITNPLCEMVRATAYQYKKKMNQKALG